MNHEETLTTPPPSQLDRSLQLARLLIRHRIPAMLANTETRCTRQEARAFTEDLEALGPTAVKFGQMMATRPDLVAPELRRALERLQSNVAPMPWEQVAQIISEDLADPFELFAQIDPEPLAAGSLGQVHAVSYTHLRAHET